MDIKDFGLPVLAHSAVFWMKDEKGEQLKDEKGKKIGIEFWSLDSVQGLKAQIAASRARAAMEERSKELSEDDLLAERIHAIKEINIETAALMFKGVRGDLKINGDEITTENAADAMRCLPDYMVRDMVAFVNDPAANYAVKP